MASKEELLNSLETAEANEELFKKIYGYALDDSNFLKLVDKQLTSTGRSEVIQQFLAWFRANKAKEAAEQKEVATWYNNQRKREEQKTSNDNSVIFVIFVPLDTDENKKIIPFPSDCLPAQIRAYVTSVAESLQVPVDMAASFTIGMLSLCLQGKYEVQPKTDWIEPINLYLLVVARPSERKSPTLKEIAAPIFKYMAEENKQRAPEIKSYEIKKRILTRKLKSIEEALAKPGKKKTEGDNTVSKGWTMQDALDCQKEIDELEEIKSMVLILDDVTPESLIKAMKENNEKMAIVSAEGGIFGMLAGRYSENANMDIFLKGYSGEFCSVSRVVRENDELKKPCLTMVLAAQPQLISDIMENKQFRGRGLLARFLYCVPESSTGKRVYNSMPINTVIRSSYNDLIKRLLDIPMLDEPRILQFSSEAHRLSGDFFRFIESKYNDQDYSNIEDWLGKLHGNTVRIAGIFHVVKHELNAYNVQIEEDTMQAAIQIGKYYLEHALHAFSIMGALDSPEVQDAKYIAKKLYERDKNDKNDNITVRELFRLCQRFQTVDVMQPALRILQEHGYISIATNRTGMRGRPTETVYINPEFIQYEDRKRGIYYANND